MGLGLALATLEFAVAPGQTPDAIYAPGPLTKVRAQAAQAAQHESWEAHTRPDPVRDGVWRGLGRRCSASWCWMARRGPSGRWSWRSSTTSTSSRLPAGPQVPPSLGPLNGGRRPSWPSAPSPPSPKQFEGTGKADRGRDWESGQEQGERAGTGTGKAGRDRGRVRDRMHPAGGPCGERSLGDAYRLSAGPASRPPGWPGASNGCCGRRKAVGPFHVCRPCSEPDFVLWPSKSSRAGSCLPSVQRTGLCALLVTSRLCIPDGKAYTLRHVLACPAPWPRPIPRPAPCSSAPPAPALISSFVRSSSFVRQSFFLLFTWGGRGWRPSA